MVDWILVVFIVFGSLVVIASLYDAYLRWKIWKLTEKEIEKRRRKIAVSG